MLKLCGNRVSNYYNKARLALLEKGVPFDEEDVGVPPPRSEDWLSRSPMGRVPVLEVDGRAFAESQVICEYLEEAHPEKPLLPRDPVARAKVRELIAMMELNLELVARRLYNQVFWRGPKVSDETRREVEKDLAKGVRAFKQLAKFDPFIAGAEVTLADCAAFVHLPLVSLATKHALGRDVLEDVPELKPYLNMLGERPAFKRVNDDRKAAQAELIARAKA